MQNNKQINRRSNGVYPQVASEKERRRALRCITHDVSQRAPTSKIFFNKPFFDAEAAESEAEAAAAAAARRGEGGGGLYKGLRTLRETAAAVAAPAAAGAPDAAAAAGSSSSAADTAAAATLQQEINECFCLFDRDKDGKVEVNEVVNMLRSLGFIIFPEQKRKFEILMKNQAIKEIDLKTFSLIANKGFPRQVETSHIISSFDLLDREKKGKVNLNELNQVLTFLGEKISSEDWNKLIDRSLSVRDISDLNYLNKFGFLKLFAAPVEGEGVWGPQHIKGKTNRNTPLL